jgi:hypothetical protein
LVGALGVNGYQAAMRIRADDGALMPTAFTAITLNYYV